MKWFKHDADASSDAKIKKLIIRHGAIGYAVYFHCLELIAGKVSNDNISFELEHDSEIIADNLRIQGTGDKSGMDVVEGIMRTIIGLNLFEERGGSITCPKMLKRLDSSMTNNKQFRELIKDARNNHDNLIESHDSLTKNHDSVMTSHDSVNKSADDVMIEKNRIEKNRREENITPSDSNESVSPKGERDAPTSKRVVFIPPSIAQVKEYCSERNNGIDPEEFVAFYNSKGWMIGKNKMKKWKDAVITWEKSRKSQGRASPSSLNKPSQRTLGNTDRWEKYYAEEEAKNAKQG